MRRRLDGRKILLWLGALGTVLQLIVWMRPREQTRAPRPPLPSLPDWRTSTRGTPPSRWFLRPDPDREAPLAQVYRDPRVTLYSRLPNRIHSVSRHGSVTWLATAWGARRYGEGRGIARHYGEDSGLPDRNVTAIAADADGSAWCVAQRPAAEGSWPGTAFLCRFDLGTERWVTLRSVPSPRLPQGRPPQGRLPGTGRPAVVTTGRFVFFSLGALGGGEAGAALLVWDNRERVWQAAAPPKPFETHDPRFGRGRIPNRRSSIAVNFLLADGGSPDTVWMGTSAGLLSYDAARRLWTGFRDERAFFAGAAGKKGDAGALWLLSRPAASPEVGWTLTRFETRDRVSDWKLPGPNSPFSSRSLFASFYSPPGIGVAEDGAVWVPGPADRSGFSNAVFHVLDRPSGRLRTLALDSFRDPDPLGAVPDEALLPFVTATRRAPEAPWLYQEARDRFARWFRPGAPLPPGITYADRQNSAADERPSPPVPHNIHVYSRAATGETAWLLGRISGSGRQIAARFDTAAGRWKIYGEESGFPTEQAFSRLVSDGDTVWALTDENAYRFAPETGRWIDIAAGLRSAPEPWTIRDLAVEETGDRRTVWALLLGKWSSSTAIRLARYDKRDGTWALQKPEGVEDGAGRSAQSLLVERDAVWIAADACALRFDRRSRIWRKIAPPHLPGGPIRRITRSDDGALWFIGAENVLRWKERP